MGIWRRCGCCAASCGASRRCASSKRKCCRSPKSPAIRSRPRPPRQAGGAENGRSATGPRTSAREPAAHRSRRANRRAAASWLSRHRRRRPSRPAAGSAASRRGIADGKIRNEKDLERYQAIFDNAAFWKKLGEEHQNPLIVTGTVLFTNTQSSGFVNTNREIIDPLGRRVVQPYRVYMERKGFIIEPRFMFIDGRTGAVLYSDRFHEEILYPAQQQTPPLSSYFELMDRLIPSFLGSLSTQRIRGTRVLLK